MPIRLCLVSGCSNEASYRGRCPDHARRRETATHHNKRLYNSKRWRVLREYVLAARPLCAVCGGIANNVDHVHPIEDGGARWDPANLQPLCPSCHSKKTRREQDASP